MHIPSSRIPTVRSSAEIKKLKNREYPFLRSAAYTVIAAVCDGLLATAVHASVIVFLFSLIPAVVLGTVFALIQNFDEHTRSLEDHIQHTADTADALLRSYAEKLEELDRKASVNGSKISATIGEFHQLVEHAGTTLQFYDTVRELLNDNYQQKSLIQTFLQRAMNGPLFVQPMEEDEFYNLAMDGIKQCSTWQAIHQGSIKKLSSLSYLKQLRESEYPEKQRIVILTKDEARELNDPDIVSRFLVATEGTRSYWIDEDDFCRTFDMPSKARLDDAALYDGKLLILRQRETKLAMMALTSHKDRACSAVMSAFKVLNLNVRLEMTETSLFKEICLPS